MDSSSSFVPLIMYISTPSLSGRCFVRQVLILTIIHPLFSILLILYVGRTLIQIKSPDFGSVWLLSGSIPFMFDLDLVVTSVVICCCFLFCFVCFFLFGFVLYFFLFLCFLFCSFCFFFWLFQLWCLFLYSY